MTKEAYPLIQARYAGYVDTTNLEDDDEGTPRRVVELADNETVVGSSAGATSSYLPAFKNETPSDGQSPIWSTANSQYEAGDIEAGRTVFFAFDEESSQISGTVTDSEFDIAHTLAAGDLNEVGRGLHSKILIETQGGISSGAITLKWRLGNSVILTLPPFNTDTSTFRYGVIDVWSRVTTAGSSGVMYSAMGMCFWKKNAQLEVSDATTSGTIDLTAALDVEWSVSIDTSLNKAKLVLFETKVIRP